MTPFLRFGLSLALVSSMAMLNSTCDAAEIIEVRPRFLSADQLRHPAVKITIEDSRMLQTFQEGRCLAAAIDSNLAAVNMDNQVIGRKGCSTLGANLLLPPGQSLSQIVYALAKRAYQQNGYRVVDAASKESAIDVNVAIIVSWVDIYDSKDGSLNNGALAEAHQGYLIRENGKVVHMPESINTIMPGEPYDNWSAARLFSLNLDHAYLSFYSALADSLVKPAM